MSEEKYSMFRMFLSDGGCIRFPANKETKEKRADELLKNYSNYYKKFVVILGIQEEKTIKFG